MAPQWLDRRASSSCGKSRVWACSCKLTNTRESRRESLQICATESVRLRHCSPECPRLCPMKSLSQVERSFSATQLYRKTRLLGLFLNHTERASLLRQSFRRTQRAPTLSIKLQRTARTEAPISCCLVVQTFPACTLSSPKACGPISMVSVFGATVRIANPTPISVERVAPLPIQDSQAARFVVPFSCQM